MKYRKALDQIKPYIPGKFKPGAIKLASNENPLGASPQAVTAINNYAEKVSLYPDANCTELKAKLAAKYKLVSDNFIVGNGSDEIFLFVAGLLLEAGDQMVTSEATFSEYTFATRLFGGEPVYAPMQAGKYQLPEILNKVTEKTKIIFIANPNNPTGTIITNDELKDFLRKISKDVLVVLDEAYYEYVVDETYPESIELIKEYPNLLITRTFSKIYGLAGLRVGYGIGNQELIENLNKTREPFNVSSIAQTAALAALTDEKFLWDSVENNNLGKAYLYQELDALGLEYYQTECNFICINIGRDCLDAFEKIMEMGVTIRPLKSFGLDQSIRVTVGTPEQNKKFIDCLKKYLGR